ncbi:MAG: hypothetical protein IT320_00060 [Anaerolineae bacterium]|nr:hypothetical protein [Anaerolineae bacterium]
MKAPEPVVISQPQPRTAPKSRSSEVAQSESPEVPNFRSYELRKYDQLRRLDIRITGEQKRYLDDLEEDLRQSMPEMERDNPAHQRITKNSFIRVLLEIARQLDLRVTGEHVHNEADLLQAVFDTLQAKLPDFRSSEVPESESAEAPK